jgi:parallel beta-helix repeat protein
MNGNDHLIEYNDLHHLCLSTGDVGAFYLGRDYTERGVVVQYNFFHDLGGHRGDANAVYLDDCASGVVIRGNVILRASRGVMLGGGVDNVIEGNTFIACGIGVIVDGRGTNRAPVWHDMVYQTMRERLFARQPTAPPYATRYPELARLLPWYQRDDGIPPVGNRIVRNFCQGGEFLRIHWGALPEHLEVAGNLEEGVPAHP